MDFIFLFLSYNYTNLKNNLKIMVQLLAFLTMFIDHLWFMIFTQDQIFRIIWRIAFPLFAWWVVRGYKHTKNLEKYSFRLLLLWLVTQIPVYALFWDEFYNVCFTLFAWVLSLAMLHNDFLKKTYLSYILVWIIIYLTYHFRFDYWGYGILMILGFYYFWEKSINILYFLLITILYYCIDYETFSFNFHIQLFSIISPILLLYTPITKYDFKLNRYFKYGFYPIHFIVIYIISLFIS